MAKYLFKPPFLVKKGYTQQAEIITREYRKRAELLHFQLIRKGRGGRGAEPRMNCGSSAPKRSSSKEEAYSYKYTTTDNPSYNQKIKILQSKIEGATSYYTLGYYTLGSYSSGNTDFFDNIRASGADYTTINGYRFYEGARYDIKSGSKAPYDYNSSWDLGLNQLFVGQDPYAAYRGDPGDGIYHDECEINTLTNTKLSLSNEIFNKLIDKSYELKLPFKIAEGYEIAKICEIRYIQIHTEISQTQIAKGMSGYMYNAQPTYTMKFSSKIREIRCIAGLLNTMEYFEFIPYRQVYSFERLGSNKLSGTGYYHPVRIEAQPYLTRYCCFYANGELENHPLNLKVFIDEWNDFHKLYVHEDDEWWQDFVAPVMVFVGFAISVFSFGSATAAFGALSSAASGSAAAVSAGVSLAAGVGGVLGGVGLAVSGIGMSQESGSLMKIGKILGFVGSIVTLGASMVNLARTAVSSAANSAKSMISSAGNATQNGLNQTSSMYLNTGAMNASGNGSSTMSFGELLKSGDSMSFGEAINTNIALSASASDNLANAGLSVIKSTVKAYSSAKDAFKNPNDYDDDEVPVSSDKSEEKEVLYHYDNRLSISGKYASEDNTDMGLMEGSMAYLKSQLEKPVIEPASIFAEQETRVLPLKEQIDYFAQIKKYYKKAKSKK